MGVNMCKDSTCSTFMKDMMKKCEGVEAMKEMVQGLSPMMESCDDKCAMGFVDMGVAKCDMGEKAEKVCDSSADCKTKFCVIKKECTCDKPILGMEAKEWKKGCGEAMDA